MKLDQVSATPFTLRTVMGSVSETTLTMRKLRQIGYRAMQIGPAAAVDDVTMRKILDDEGLVCSATHDPLVDLLAEPRRVADRLDVLGAKYSAMPYPRDVDLTNPAAVLDLAASLNAAAQVLAERGKVLTYHNHELEFYRLPSGQTVIDTLLANAPHLALEPDTYWIQVGGVCPEKFLTRYRGRIPLLHIKDYLVKPERGYTYGEIGRGNLDWPAIIAAADAGGTVWYLVEQDECPGDPLDSLAESYRYIAQTLVEQ